MESLIIAATKLWPEFGPMLPRKELKMTVRREFDPFTEDLEKRTLPVWRRIRGQGLAEYALVIALIAIVAIIGLIFIGNQISAALSNIGSSV